LNEGGSDAGFMALDNDISTLSVGKNLEREIHVDSNILKQYVDIYQTDPQHPATITLENGQLQMEAPQGGLRKSPLFAKSDNVFFLKVIAAEIEFVKDNDDKLSEMIVYFNGENQVCKKVK
jgi:uncharacterized protein DUF3471